MFRLRWTQPGSIANPVRDRRVHGSAGVLKTHSALGSNAMRALEGNTNTGITAREKKTEEKNRRKKGGEMLRTLMHSPGQYRTCHRRCVAATGEKVAVLGEKVASRLSHVAANRKKAHRRRGTADDGAVACDV
eukprot:104833-Rhodomonas_salina.1